MSSPITWQVSKVDVPPPAPSPPQTVVEPPPNVFDYLVEERSPSNRSGPGSSTNASPASQRDAESSASSPSSSRPTSKSVALQDTGIVYGGGPVAKGFHKFDSDLTMMGVDSQDIVHTVNVTDETHRTPAARGLADVKRSEMMLKREGSDKKRKRAVELDISRHNSADASDAAPPLHSGLTGGLAKLLGRAQSKKVEASPLSPKKRSKPNADDDTQMAHYEERRPRLKREDHQSSSQHHEDSDRNRKHKKHRRREEAASKVVKAIEYQSQPNDSLALMRKSTSSRTPSSYSSHSELFISLIDKPHSSHKGQSIWGTLKTFHESIQARVGSDAGSYYDGSSSGSSQREDEEKRLLKALRVKINKHGEVVLFARPDFELPEEDEMEISGVGGSGQRKRLKQIEA